MSTQTPTAAAAMGSPMPPPSAAPGQPVTDAYGDYRHLEFDAKLQLGRTGLKQYGGFLFEEFLQTLRGQQGAKAYREVLENSPLVGGIMRLLTLTMRQVSRFIEPFSDDPEDVARAERIEQGFDDMSISWEDFIAEVVTMLGYGYAPMEIVWKTCKGPGEDGTTRSRYNDGLVMPRKIMLMAQDTLFRWGFDEDGGVRAFIQLAPPEYVMRTIPIEKMLLFRPDLERGNPEGKSLLRSGYFSWVTIKRFIEFEGITAERDAVGVPIAKIPGVTMQAGSPQAAMFTQVKKIVQNLRVDDQAGVVIPSDTYPGTSIPMFELALLGSTGRSVHFDYGSTITRHEVRLAISMLADIMLLGHDKVGSFSLSRDKRSMLADGMGAWLDSIFGVLNRHLIPRIFAYNGWPLDRPCKMGHGGVETDDVEQLANAVQKFAAAGMPMFPDLVLENHIRSEAGLPERAEDDGLDDPQEPAGAGADADDPAQPVAAKPVPTKGVRKFRAQPRTWRGSYQRASADMFTALQALADRARVGRGDAINHGFHVEEAPGYDERTVSGKAIEGAPVERVKLKDLTATQPTVRRASVRNFLENPGIVAPGQRTLSGELEDRPVVVRAGGKTFIHDGHHRLAARVLMGHDDVMARVVNLGGEGE